MIGTQKRVYGYLGQPGKGGGRTDYRCYLVEFLRAVRTRASGIGYQRILRNVELAERRVVACPGSYPVPGECWWGVLGGWCRPDSVRGASGRGTGSLQPGGLVHLWWGVGLVVRLWLQRLGTLGRPTNGPGGGDSGRAVKSVLKPWSGVTGGLVGLRR